MADHPRPARDRSQIGALRDTIDALDDQILELINRRLSVAGRIGRLKRDGGDPVVDREREARVVDRLLRRNRGPLDSDGTFRGEGTYVSNLGCTTREFIEGRFPRTSGGGVVFDGTQTFKDLTCDCAVTYRVTFTRR